MTALSIQEAAEQHLIEESVKLIREEKKVLAILPFTQDPVKSLTRQHGREKIHDKTILYAS